MVRPVADMGRRTLTVDTGRRSIDLPVDASGRLRRVAVLDGNVVSRAADGDGPIGFRGHAAVFNRRTWIGSKTWGFAEEIMPSAFTKTINDGADVRFLINHDPNLVLARTASGTLRLSEDEVGLFADADMAPVSYARDLAVSLERRDVTQMSFGFEMVDYRWSVEADGTEVLRHYEVKLFDVSAVTYPAYIETDAALRMDLLAAARAHGFADVDLGVLAQRLADPDPDLLSALRALVRSVDAEAPAADPEPDDEPAPAAVADHDPGDPQRDAAFADLSLTLLGELV